MQPVSLYFHIPFCKMKCIYCDFYSVVNRDDQIPLFFESLLHEFNMHPPPSDEYSRVDTMYFGGGTPSLLRGQQLERLLKTVEKHLPISADAEITLEANPGEVDPERLTDYRSLGVNRISFGLQSFNDAQLRLLGRLHRSQHNAPSVEMARSAGFNNVNVDLIFHLPGQDDEDLQNDLRQMLALDTEHLSLYSLTVEKGTPLFQYVKDGRVHMTDEDLDAAMYRTICQSMAEAGFEHYEVSNFGKPGYHSQHNSNYWNGSHYYSYGPSAHSYNGESRWWNVRDLSEYFFRYQNRQSPIETTEKLDINTRQSEYFLTRLRTRGGVKFNEWRTLYHSRFPNDILDYFQTLKMEHPEWVKIKKDGLQLTEEGWLFTDKIVEECADRIQVD